jgi:hypothetical protein
VKEVRRCREDEPRVESTGLSCLPAQPGVGGEKETIYPN